MLDSESAPLDFINCPIWMKEAIRKQANITFDLGRTLGRTKIRFLDERSNTSKRLLLHIGLINPKMS